MNAVFVALRSEEHTSELQSQSNLVCRLLLEKKKNMLYYILSYIFFFFNDTATTEIYTLSLHDALPISEKDQDIAQHSTGGLLMPRRQRSWCKRRIELGADLSAEFNATLAP